MRHLYLLIAAAALALLATAGGIALTEPPPQAPPAAVGEVGHLVWHSGSYTVELTDVPCPFVEFTRDLEEEGVPPARRSVLTQPGLRFAGCWVYTMGGDVLLIDPSRQEASETPISWFTRDPGV